MSRKIVLKRALSDYAIGATMAIMTYYTLRALESAATIELKKREIVRRRIITSYRINVVNNMLSFELMLTIQSVRGGSLEMMILDFLIHWLLEYVTPFLPERLLKSIVWFTRFKLVKLITALLVGSTSIMTISDIIRHSNNTLFAIPLENSFTWNDDLSNLLKDLPPCDDYAMNIFESLVKGKLTGDELDEAIDNLIAFLEDTTNGSTVPSVIVCLALLLISIFGVNRGRFNLIIERLWRAYKAGRLSKSRYLALLRLLRRKKIAIRT